MKKSAPPVEEKKPEKESKPVPEPVPVFDIAEIEKKIPKAFRGYVKPLVQWADSVEKRLNAIQKEMPETIKASMTEWATEVRQKQMEALKSAPAAPSNPGMGGIGDFMQLIPYFLGGGRDDEMMDLNKSILRMNIERMKKDMDFTDAVKNAIVSKIAGKAAGDIVGGV